MSSNGAIFSKAYLRSSTRYPWQIYPDYSLFVYFADAKFDSICGNCTIFVRKNLSHADTNKVNNLIKRKDPDFALETGRIMVVTWYRARAYYFRDKVSLLCIIYYFS